MKIQLDYTKKTITLENNVNLGELSDKLTKILPDWKEWELVTSTIINNWSNPIIIERYTRPWFQYYPYIGPTYTTSGGTHTDISTNTVTVAQADHTFLSGVYNLELN